MNVPISPTSPPYKPGTLWKIRGKSSWEKLSRGKLFSTDALWFRFVVIESPTREPLRLASAVSRKYGNAVTRNLFKRRVREIFRELEKEGAITDSLMILVGPAKNFSSPMTFETMKTSCTDFVKQLYS